MPLYKEKLPKIEAFTVDDLRRVGLNQIHAYIVNGTPCNFMINDCKVMYRSPKSYYIVIHTQRITLRIKEFLVFKTLAGKTTVTIEPETEFLNRYELCI